MPPTPVVLGPRAEFIEKNLGLVHSCAGRFKGRGIEYDDLFSAGLHGARSKHTTALTVPAAFVFPLTQCL